jgi:hypothetical protein
LEGELGGVDDAVWTELQLTLGLVEEGRGPSVRPVSRASQGSGDRVDRRVEGRTGLINVGTGVDVDVDGS